MIHKIISAIIIITGAKKLGNHKFNLSQFLLKDSSKLMSRQQRYSALRSGLHIFRTSGAY